MCKAENHQHTDDIIDMVEDVCTAWLGIVQVPNSPLLNYGLTESAKES